MNSFYQKKKEAVVNYFSSDIEKGLSSSEAQERLEKYGPNRLPEKEKLAWWQILIDQFKSPLVIILLVAGIITLALNRPFDSIIIWAALVVNSLVGYVQERKAANTLASLKKMLTLYSVVQRDGKKKEVAQEDIVPGDILILKSGDKIPADGRLVESEGLEINQASLTGEWEPDLKEEKVISEDLTLADRDNMVYAGTSIEKGQGKAVVVATGEDSEFGKIAHSVSQIEDEQTPYQRRVANFSKKVSIFLMIACLFIFLFGYFFRGGGLIEMFEISVAVAVSSIPEGLPIAIIVILAVGMGNISKQKGLVRKLASAETLGSTSIICADKTGTLTEAQMEVESLYGLEKEISKNTDAYQRALQIINLDNESFIDHYEKGEPVIKGGSTESAFLRFGIKEGFNKNNFLKDERLIKQIPFRTEQKFSASLFSNGGGTLLTKGAGEVLIDRSKFVLINGEKKKITPEIKKKLKVREDEIGGKGFRVLGLAYRSFELKNKDKSVNEIVNNLVFVGFVALKDPIRKEGKAALHQCRKAGIRPIIITGDSRVTARAVANELELGIQEEEILTGQELSQISDEELAEQITKIKVYARVEPIQKLRIVEAWKKKDEVVAMTGDGVNDAAALQKADVGVALNSGTDVAKEVSDLVLLEDNFSVILAAVEEGRSILHNIRKVVTYLLSDSFTELILIGVSFIAGWPIPLAAMQILWINLVEDSLPSIALSFEPKEDNLLEEKPPAADEPLLTKEMKVIIVIIGLLTDLFLLGTFYFLWQNAIFNMAHIRTIIFAALSMDSLFYLFSCKNLHKNIWEIDFLSNKFLLWAWVGVVFLVLAGIYIPFLQVLLGTVALGWNSWLIVGGLSLIEILGLEGAKWFFIHRYHDE